MAPAARQLGGWGLITRPAMAEQMQQRVGPRPIEEAVRHAAVRGGEHITPPTGDPVLHPTTADTVVLDGATGEVIPSEDGLSTDRIQLYVPLLNEGTDVLRPPRVSRGADVIV